MASLRLPFGRRREAGLATPVASTLSPLEAVRRRPLAVVVPVIAALCIALAVGLTRQAVYEAQVRMGIQLAGNVPGALTGYGAGAEQLVQGYARALSARQITSAVSRRTGLDAPTLAQRVFASAVPSTPIFVIHARGPNAPAAVRVATVTAEELVHYVAHVNSNVAQSKLLLARYAVAQRDRLDAIARRDADQRRYAQQRTAARRRALAADRADAKVASDRVNNVEAAYRDSTRSAGFESLVQVFSAPNDDHDAASDRGSKLQLLGFVGIIAGLVVGTALAIVLAARDPLKSTP